MLLFLIFRDQYQETNGMVLRPVEGDRFADVVRLASFDSWFSVLMVKVALASGSVSGL